MRAPHLGLALSMFLAALVGFRAAPQPPHQRLPGGRLIGVHAPRLCLAGADLNHADLSEANLPWADFRGADLRGAKLRCAVLDGADLQAADLRGADLRGTALEYANLRGARLTGIFYDITTTWPAGFDPKAYPSETD